jgi:hypothetical protein
VGNVIWHINQPSYQPVGCIAPCGTRVNDGHGWAVELHGVTCPYCLSLPDWRDRVLRAFAFQHLFNMVAYGG